MSELWESENYRNPERQIGIEPSGAFPLVTKWLALLHSPLKAFIYPSFFMKIEQVLYKWCSLGIVGLHRNKMVVIMGAIQRVEVTGIHQGLKVQPTQQMGPTSSYCSRESILFLLWVRKKLSKLQADCTNGFISPAGNFCLPVKQNRNISNC